MVFQHRHFKPDGSLDWRATVEASLAAAPATSRRVPRWLWPVVRRLPIGHCLHCRTPWGIAVGHATAVNETMTVYVLCERCWPELPVEARLAYYHAQYKLWLRDTATIPYGPQRDAAVMGLSAIRGKLEAAVRAGR